ncbi:MAG: sigma-70 family RNA polymerase sigma factor [Phycisphaerales bacterium]|nr:sigma-70 family RNA polymerase sigma factor [Phycisphaerales bacterium]
MHDQRTTASVERYLSALRGDEDPDPIIRALLARAANRLQGLCTNMLRRHYPRLIRANVQEEETLSLLVERLIKAMRHVKPSTVREFFALANQHLHWELNDFARQMGRRPPSAPLTDDVAAPCDAPAEAGCITQILEAIERLPEELREVFSLVHIQGLTHEETADVLGVSTKTVQRRLQQSTIVLAGKLRGVLGGDLELGAVSDDATSDGCAAHGA